MSKKITANDIALMQQNAYKAASLLKQLANHHRLMILCHLAMEPRTVGELQEQLTLSQSALSQHLAKMRLEGIVESTKQGQYVYYRVCNKEAKALLATLYQLFCNEEQPYS